MEKTINFEDIKEKILASLKDSNWDIVLKPFINSDEFTKILDFLYKENLEGRTFTPSLSKMFEAFKFCNYNDLKVVILGQDPYSGIDQADGVAFSCSIGKLQPSLNYILKAVNKEVYDNQEVSIDKDLRRWSKQGVLLLNSALTVQFGKPGTHVEIWKNFITFVIDTLSIKTNNLVFILLGNKAKEYSELISDSKHLILTAKHPASAAYNKLKEWDSNLVFKDTNSYLLDKHNLKINW